MPQRTEFVVPFSGVQTIWAQAEQARLEGSTFPVGQPACLFHLSSLFSTLAVSQHSCKRASRQWPGGFDAVYSEQWTVSRPGLLKLSGMKEQGFSLTVSCRMIFL